jgi:hypothetical protein
MPADPTNHDDRRQPEYRAGHESDFEPWVTGFAASRGSRLSCRDPAPGQTAGFQHLLLPSDRRPARRGKASTAVRAHVAVTNGFRPRFARAMSAMASPSGCPAMRARASGSLHHDLAGGISLLLVISLVVHYDIEGCIAAVAAPSSLILTATWLILLPACGLIPASGCCKTAQDGCRRRRPSAQRH